MKKKFLSVIGVLIINFLLTQILYAQTTAFTYQGNLKNGATPASGNYDFEFALFDAVAGGTQIGSTVSVTNVVVADGVFFVQLDFGSNFPGANRFLEIKVKQSGGGALTPLTPRQQITGAPYSVKSLNAENAANAANATTAGNALQLGGVAANQYVLTGDGRLSNARNPLPGSASYIQNTNLLQTNASFFVGGNGTVTGTLSGDEVSAATQFNLGNNRILSNAGTGNLFAGVDAGNVNAGTSNSFFGRNAGKVNSSGSSNSFFGASAGFSNTTGNNNAFFGLNAGALNTAGFNNSFFGAGAGDSNTTAGNNSFFGTSAGTSNTTGFNNSFFGTSAGQSNTTGVNNAFFGRSAGISNTTGDLNTFVGIGAGNDNTTADDNSFFGANAGFNTVSGTDNSFFGSNAGFVNGTGSANSFFGKSAGNNSLGSSNSFFGKSAGEVNGDGTGNSFFGFNAGALNVTGDFNTFIGLSAGNTNTTGSNNTIIGTNADVNTNNLSFATAIGASARVFASNTIVLGRTNGSDIVIIHGLGASGFTSLCRNNSDQISTCSSSLRYKTNVESFADGLRIVNRLRPVTFNWKAGGMLDLGLVAEEVAEVEPLLITRNDKGEVEGVKYDRLGIVLVNAVGEQQTQIEKHQTEIDEQKETIKGQQQLLEKQQSEIKKQKAEFDAFKKFICSQNPAAEICQPQN